MTFLLDKVREFEEEFLKLYEKNIKYVLDDLKSGKLEDKVTQQLKMLHDLSSKI